MCKCSETGAEANSTKTPVTSAGPTMKPLVPLSRQVRFGEEGAEDQTAGRGFATAGSRNGSVHTMQTRFP